ncbi:hypothetical protein FBU59_000908, partial [Linderina macrospora]
MALASGIALASIADLVHAAMQRPLARSFNVFVVGLFVQSAAYVLAVDLHYYEQTRARTSSAVLLLYWLTSLIVDGVTLRSDMHRKRAFLPARYAELAMILALFSAELWPRRLVEYALAEDDDLDDESANRFGVHSPAEDANIFSQLTFSWMSPLLKLGQTKVLTESDLWDLPRKYAPSKIAAVFEEKWQRELDNGEKRRPSVIRALWNTLGLPFALAGLYKLIQDILQFTQPVLLSKLIGFVSSFSTDNPQPISNGYFYAFSMLVLQIVQTLFLHQYFQLGMTTGMKIKASLTSAIYRKALKLSNDTRQSYTIGNITTLFSVDVERIGGVVDYMHIAWSGPVQIIFAVYLLYSTLGWSVFAGILVMILAIPVNGWLTARMRDLQKAQMKNKDKRTTMIDEALSGIKVIKLYAWERSFLENIRNVRENFELETLRKYGIMNAYGSLSMMVVPFLVSFLTFFVYAVFDGKSHGPLTAQLVFVALSLFNLLRFPLTMFPVIISSIVEASVALGRIYKLLISDELDLDSVTRLESVRKTAAAGEPETAVRVADAAFKWERDGDNILDNIDFAAKSNEHLAIVGRVGSGKSSLVSALLGDMRKARGEVVIHGKIAYASQQPWIMNATLRDNILFGLKYNEEFYNRVIDACALRPDLDILSAGDMTEIGEKGINLSGGQKARVSLARAVYSRADVYILDDPLSAVDAHVGRHLFDQVLGSQGLLKSRTRIHVTNAVQYLTRCDSVMLLRDGQIAEYGSAMSLMERRGLVYSLVQEFGNGESSTPASSAVTPTASFTQLSVPADAMDADSSSSSSARRRSTVQTLPAASVAPIQRTGQLRTTDNSSVDQLIEAEISATGKVSTESYIDYLRACTFYGIFLFVSSMIMNQGLLVLSNVWLKTWSSANEQHEREGTVDPHTPMYYITVYGLFGVVSAIFCQIRSQTVWTICAVNSGKTTHKNMLYAVFRSPMSFFDTTPLGRILQRFSKDQDSVDTVIPRTLASWFQNLSNIFFSVVVIVVSFPAFGVVLVPVIVFFFYLKHYFLTTSRTLKRLDSTTRSPIYASFQETLGGASTVRAYGQAERFMAENIRKLDANQRCVFPYLSLNRWLAVRLEFMSAGIIFATALLGVLSLKYSAIDAALVGLSVTYALQSTQQVNWMLRMECDLENSMCDYVRIQEYEDLQSEAPDVIEDNRPTEQWPEQGVVEFRNYSTRYREGLDLVLRNISFTIQPREKVGIVGRTGAGKSSLTLALFRIIESSSGQILIDGEDVSKYGLFDLRSRLSIIPQDPVLFAGT